MPSLRGELAFQAVKKELVGVNPPSLLQPLFRISTV